MIALAYAMKIREGTSEKDNQVTSYVYVYSVKFIGDG